MKVKAARGIWTHL